MFWLLIINNCLQARIFISRVGKKWGRDKALKLWSLTISYLKRKIGTFFLLSDQIRQHVLYVTRFTSSPRIWYIPIVLSSHGLTISLSAVPCTIEKALTSEVSSLLLTATVLEGLFREYHSSAALGQQRPEVTKQPLVCDWLATSEALYDVNYRFAQNTEGTFVQGVNTWQWKPWLDYPCIVTAPKYRKRPPQWCKFAIWSHEGHNRGSAIQSHKGGGSKGNSV